MIRTIILFASVFLFVSCTEVEFNNPDDPDSPNYIGKRSSSSGSSGYYNFTVQYGAPVTYEGETYNTVIIGEQIWFQRNLNYAVEGSKCNGDKTANCDMYGKLYDWATAMKLSPSCNTIPCASKVSTKHQGICPDSWRIPSNDDWDKLMNFVGGSSGGKYLKATSGWDFDGNGNDDLGFSALPGGYVSYFVQFFNSIGSSGAWWSASEESDWNACSLEISYNDSDRSYDNKRGLLSVRCMQDYSGAGVSSSSVPSSSSITGYSSSSSENIPSGCPNAEIDDNTISCGGQSYKTVEINNQVWMAENLNYDVPGSKCYNNNVAYCAIYGRLYDWATAMALPASCKTNSCASLISTKHQGICPDGWHIPDNDEWDALVDFAGGSSAGNHLRATSDLIQQWQGDDDFGFSALPGGLSFSDGSFYFVGNCADWWTASEHNKLNAYDRSIYYNVEYVNWNDTEKGDLFSVRCLQD